MPGTAASAFAATDYVPPTFREPVMLSSENGVLEVTLTAHQGEVALDTTSVPVKHALLFGYRLDKGISSNGMPRRAGCLSRADAQGLCPASG